MKLHLKINCLTGLYFEGDVDLLNIKTASGEVTILASHIPLLTTIEICRMYYVNDETREEFAISGGVLLVDEKGANITTFAIERFDEIDFNRALDAKNRALDRINNPTSDIDVKRAEIALQRALNRLSFRG